MCTLDLIPYFSAHPSPSSPHTYAINIDDMGPRRLTATEVVGPLHSLAQSHHIAHHINVHMGNHQRSHQHVCSHHQTLENLQNGKEDFILSMQLSLLCLLKTFSCFSACINLNVKIQSEHNIKKLELEPLGAAEKC